MAELVGVRSKQSEKARAGSISDQKAGIAQSLVASCHYRPMAKAYQPQPGADSNAYGRVAGGFSTSGIRGMVPREGIIRNHRQDELLFVLNMVA
ncbi:hypothetical protein XH99_17960 [Bradyrhizobium nanningense]|uniref:Uncharacterized protein n=1 Tax=Bradyrhizobium nanningense TaxID=1325118 RepID=A0A4V1L211_9BRAD|nr:hypothetical protein XH84_35340 [Bradyrhizobium nanningense]RXH27000.1 hypothetical protein XH99_17960 [Bradyrhizobium nanningense]